jgi:hypothetical protein
VEGHLKAIRFGRMMKDYPDTLQRKLLFAFQNLLIELQVAVESVGKGKRAAFVGVHLTTGFYGKTFDEKLERAADELTRTQSKHSVAVGEEKLFYDTVLLELKDRMTRYLSDPPPESAAKLAELLECLDRLLVGRPVPTGNML